jgi:FO synthase
VALPFLSETVDIAPAIEKALHGEPLVPADAYRLIKASAEEIPLLMWAASHLRQIGKGRLITYSRKVFIPLTNMCRQQCGYCTFAKPQGDPQAHTMTPDEVLAVAEAGRQAGCKEALFSLGEKPEERWRRAREDLARLGYRSTLDYLAAMAQLVYDETGLLPHLNPGVMGYEEVRRLREVCVSMGIMLESVSLRLMERGGPHYACPGKAPDVRLRTMEYAGQLNVAFTTGILIGIGETPEERVDALFAIKELHERYGHIQEVIVQNFRVKEDIPMRHWTEPSVLDMVRTIATARLILGPEMNIQAPPNLMPDAYQTYLFAGINDWGGVSPVTPDHINPERAWPKILELKQVTEEAGFQLRERLALYPEYVRSGRWHVPGSMVVGLRGWVDASGLVKEGEGWE